MEDSNRWSPRKRRRRRPALWLAATTVVLSQQSVAAFCPIGLQQQQQQQGTEPMRTCTTRLAVATSSQTASSSPSSSFDPSKPQRLKSSNNHNKKNKRNKIRQLFRQAQTWERQGQWQRAAQTFTHILQNLDPYDAHTHLAAARLQSRRRRTGAATAAFRAGVKACPQSVHLWQAWAVHEEQVANNVTAARHLFDKARTLEPDNPYVCHAYGLLLQKHSHLCTDTVTPEVLWRQALDQTPTAALVCSLGASLVERGEWTQARALYARHVQQVRAGRQRTEVMLAAAWLEERYFRNVNRAAALLQQCVTDPNMDSARAQVAMARLEARRVANDSTTKTSSTRVTPAQRLERACKNMAHDSSSDGRVFNAWANLEVKNRRFRTARAILRRGLEQFPTDFSLMQAAGKVEERLGNYTGARHLYAASLSIEPSAPTLVAFALLELQQPDSGTTNFESVKGLFEEALLLDPRHGATYNAYARCVFEQERNSEEARSIFDRGVKTGCTDVASLYHGYAKLELALGNTHKARALLVLGRKEAVRLSIGTDSPHRDRGMFLSHTLGMLELNANNPVDALEVFLDGIKSYGNSSQLLLGAALAEARLGNVDNARQLFESSVSVDRRHAHAWQAWGVMEMKAGNYETAKILFQCGIKNAHRHGALWQVFASLESRLGNMDEARKLYAQGLKTVPGNVPLYQGWASMELRAGETQNAKSLITKALTLDKCNGAGWLVASDIEKALDNHGLAKLLLRRGIECAPNDAALYRELGDELLSEGKVVEAREIYEQGIAIDPLFASLYHSLAELEARIGNVEALAGLHKRAAAVFQNTVLPTPTDTTQSWTSNFRSGRSREVPREVAALAERVGVDDGQEFANPKPFLLDLDDLKSSEMTEGLVGSWLQLDDD